MFRLRSIYIVLESTCAKFNMFGPPRHYLNHIGYFDIHLCFVRKTLKFGFNQCFFNCNQKTERYQQVCHSWDCLKLPVPEIVYPIFSILCKNIRMNDCMVLNLQRLGLKEEQSINRIHISLARVLVFISDQIRTLFSPLDGADKGIYWDEAIPKNRMLISYLYILFTLTVFYCLFMFYHLLIQIFRLHCRGWEV